MGYNSAVDVEKTEDSGILLTITFTYVQSFFASARYRHYVPVDVPENQPTRLSTQVSIEALLEQATLRDEELEKERDIMEEVENKVDQTPWIRRTHWPKMFVGHDMKVLVKG